MQQVPILHGSLLRTLLFFLCATCLPEHGRTMKRVLQKWLRRPPVRPSFKEKNTLERRKALSVKLMTTHPERIPIIAAPARNGSPDTPQLSKEKFLVPVDFTAQAFLRELRQLMSQELDSSEALYMFVGKSALVPVSVT